MTDIHKYIIPAFILIAFSVACNKMPSDENVGYDITFSLQMSEMTKAAGQYSGSDLSQLDSFRVSGFEGLNKKLIDNQFAFKPASGDKWQVDGNPKVWESGKTLAFWADANMPAYASVAHSDSSKARFTVTSIPSTATAQWDPLIGSYRGTGDKGTATIRFFHPMTAVKFKTGLLGEPAFVSKIKSVSLKNVHSGGYAEVRRASADNLAYSWTTSAKTTVSGPFSGTESEKPFILIPQNLSTDYISMSVEIGRVSGSDTTLTVDLPASDNWIAGHCYTYTLDYVMIRPMEGKLKVTLSDWVYVDSESGKKYFDADFDSE